jgi:hypothetical protein
MRQCLSGSKWQLTPKDLTQALSRKTLKSTSQPLRQDEIGDTSRYNLHIDLIPDHLLTDAAHSLKDFTPTRSEQERKYFQAPNHYLDCCLNRCCALFPLVAQHDCCHHKLRFEMYNRQVKNNFINTSLRPGCGTGSTRRESYAGGAKARGAFRARLGENLLRD